MKKIKLKMALALILISVFSSCTKEGKQGEPGTNGQNGNSNVHSEILTAGSWVWDSGSGTRYSTWTGISSLTYDIASYGGVYLYQANSSNNGYFQLPITAPVSAGVVESDYYEYGQGTIVVYIQNSNLTDPIAQIQNPAKYKLVTISASARLANPNVDYSNYEEVKERFDLKD